MIHFTYGLCIFRMVICYLSLHILEHLGTEDWRMSTMTDQKVNLNVQLL